MPNTYSSLFRFSHLSLKMFVVVFPFQDPIMIVVVSFILDNMSNINVFLRAL